MERDWSLMKLQISLTISTHTLTWSVTLAEIYNKGTWKISTHTLTWSVTADPKSNSRSYGYFNSHAHVERDTPSIVVEEALKISTHTLTWSVTTGLDTLDDELLHFNSHAHVERDVLL